MKRKFFGMVAAAAAVGSVVGLVPMTAAHADPVLVNVCVTLNPRSLDVTINGHVLYSDGVPGNPRTCFGV
jgi:hypothetical protein